ncbi:MAG: sugar ABC transporter substrate-binding protein [Chloroflexi bacterium]|nr:sugar ABC transporter substrate-binding protein [Chloroflexota bacterium]
MLRIPRPITLTLLIAVCCLVLSTTVLAQDAVELNVVGFVVPLEEQGTPLDEAYQKFIADFEAAHPGVTVNALETPPEFDTQLLVDLAAGTAPDIWNQDASTLARLVDSGYVLDMNECVNLVPELNLDRFFPSVLAIHQREEGGPIYGLPNDFTPMVIYYNTAAFERAGVEPPQAGWTWEEFRDIAQRLTLDANGNNATSPDFDPNNVTQWGFRVRKFAFEWLYRVWQNGSDVISPDGTTASGYLDSPESIEAITWLRDLVTEAQVAPPPTTLDQMIQQLGFLDRFLQGDFAMFDRGHWELVGLRANEKFEPGIFKVVGQPQNKERATVLYESGFVIRADIPEEKKLAACQFVEAATSRAYQDTKVLTGIAISGNQEAAEAAIEQSPDPEIEQAFFDEVQYGRPPYGSIYANWPTVEAALDSMMERILAGGEVETEVAAAVEEINRELSK